MNMNIPNLVKALNREIEAGQVSSYTALVAAKTLMKLNTEKEVLQATFDSVREDYEQAARVLHGGEYEDVSMLKPLANKAAKVIERNKQATAFAARSIIELTEELDELKEKVEQMLSTPLLQKTAN